MEKENTLHMLELIHMEAVLEFICMTWMWKKVH